jgi:hypothetical protein
MSIKELILVGIGMVVASVGATAIHNPRLWVRTAERESLQYGSRSGERGVIEYGARTTAPDILDLRPNARPDVGADLSDDAVWSKDESSINSGSRATIDASIHQFGQNTYSDQKLLAMLAETQQPNYRNRFPRVWEFANAHRSAYDRPARKPAISGFAVLPQGLEEFKTVFGKPPTSDDLRAISAATKDLQSAVSVTSDAVPRSLDSFESNLTKSDSDFYVVIGHNDGSSLVIMPPPPPKTLLPLEGLSQRCKSIGKICLFLSCKSNDAIADAGANATVGRDITYQDAVQITEESSRLIEIATDADKTSFEIIEALPILIENLEKDQRVSANVKWTVPQVVIGGGAAGGLLVLAVEDQSK